MAEFVIAGFSEASKRHQKLVNNLSRRTASKISLDPETFRVIVHSDKLLETVKTPGIDRAAKARKADKEAKSIAKEIVKILRSIEEERGETITKYRLNAYPEPSVIDPIAREVFSLASYRASPEADVEIYVDITSAGAFLYTERLYGPGGIPVGVSGRAIALLDGSPRSYVAAYAAMRRGFEVIGVYPMITLRGKSLLKRAEENAAKIDERFIIKPLDLLDEYQELLENVEELEIYPYASIALKLRLLSKAIEEAKSLGIKNVVVDDVLGSRTEDFTKIIRAENVIAQEKGVHVFRPILGFSLSEIRRRESFLEVEDARDPIDLPSEKPNDDMLKILLELVLSLRA